MMAKLRVMIRRALQVTWAWCARQRYLQPLRPLARKVKPGLRFTLRGLRALRRPRQASVKLVVKISERTRRAA